MIQVAALRGFATGPGAMTADDVRLKMGPLTASLVFPSGRSHIGEVIVGVKAAESRMGFEMVQNSYLAFYQTRPDLGPRLIR